MALLAVKKGSLADNEDNVMESSQGTEKTGHILAIVSYLPG